MLCTWWEWGAKPTRTHALQVVMSLVPHSQALAPLEETDAALERLLAACPSPLPSEAVQVVASCICDAGEWSCEGGRCKGGGGVADGWHSGFAGRAAVPASGRYGFVG